jgi:multimeric flavodoxin WrbA
MLNNGYLMKVLGICGSLRKESNTNKLVHKVAETSGCAYELIYLAKTKVKPCTGCLHCEKNSGVCTVQDGMQVVYDKLLSADGIILGSPTYRWDISGAVKCFLDRTIALNFRSVPSEDTSSTHQRPLAGRPCVAVTTTAGGGHDRALKSLVLFFQTSGMTVVGKIAEVVGINDIDDMPDVLQRAEEAGKKLGETLKKSQG